MCRIFVNTYNLTNELCVEQEDIKTVPMYFTNPTDIEKFIDNEYNFLHRLDGSPCTFHVDLPQM